MVLRIVMTSGRSTFGALILLDVELDQKVLPGIIRYTARATSIGRISDESIGGKKSRSLIIKVCHRVIGNN